MAKAPTPPSAVERLIEKWNATTNPIFHSAAGQLRRAMDEDKFAARIRREECRESRERSA